MENINFEWQINKCSFIEPIFNNKEFGIYNHASFYLLEAIIVLYMSKQKAILDKKLASSNDDNKLMLRSSLSDAMLLQQLILDFKLYVKDIKKIEDNSKNSIEDEKILKILNKLMELGGLNDIEDSSKLKNTILELFDVNKREDFKEIVEYAINNRFQDEKSFNNLKKCILNQINYKYNIKYKFLTDINEILDIHDCYIDAEYLNGSQNDNINNFLKFIIDLHCSIKFNSAVLHKIVIKVQNIVNSYFSSINNNLSTDLFELKKYINTTETIIKRIKRKYKDGKGCFAIINCKRKKYYAFSGTFEINKDKAVRDQFNQFADDLNKAIFDGKYTLSKLDKNTMRYTEVVDAQNIITYIPKPISYEDTIESIKDNLELIGYTFGCCERKLLASINNKVVNLDLFIRWLPCEKCQPALVKYGNKISVYILSKNCSSEDTILHKCKLTKRFIMG